MGAEQFEGVIQSSTVENAIATYRKYAPCAPYDNIWHSKFQVDFLPEVFDNDKEAIQFLLTKARKWGNVVMCKCGIDRFAYVVLLAI